jgi:hypothetical protein
MTPGAKLQDFIFDLTEPFNHVIRRNSVLTKYLLIINNVLLTIVIVNTIITIINNGRVFRYATAIIELYCLRWFFT